jgi:hypothetical protein
MFGRREGEAEKIAGFYGPGKQCPAVVPTVSINWNLIKHPAIFC